jgi:anthranilate/para-aminobenzoate synthase component I
MKIDLWQLFRALSSRFEEGFYCEHWEGQGPRFGFDPIAVREGVFAVSLESVQHDLIADLEWAEAQTNLGLGVHVMLSYEAGALLDRVRNAKFGTEPLWRISVYDNWIQFEEDKAVPHGPKALEWISHQISQEANVFGVTSMDYPTSRQEYGGWVEKIREYIDAGDVFQVNIAHPLCFDYHGDPLELYQGIRSFNPSPYACCWFQNKQQRFLLSNSPELLVSDCHGNMITKPIAGTRKRGEGSREDEDLVDELFLSTKERAEHLMLVDLERNDLGRIAEYGSVEVKSFMHCEQYRNVSHIVSTVCARRKSEHGLVDMVRALFPGGTITGAPKLRSMEIIAELETQRRGYYTGSMGWLTKSEWVFNILIRTAQLNQGKACVHVGAGIVADSIPQKEYEETLYKAAAWERVLGGFQ